MLSEAFNAQSINYAHTRGIVNLPELIKTSEMEGSPPGQPHISRTVAGVAAMQTIEKKDSASSVKLKTFTDI